MSESVLVRLAATLVAEPRVLGEHVQGYGRLLALESAQLAAAVRRRAVLYLAASGLGLLAAGLAGVASLIWASTPARGIAEPWVFVAVPLLPAVLAVACLVAARRVPRLRPFAQLQKELTSDCAMLRDVSEA
jgi:TRAP-type C4-dicarboxylate transport system permease small subunit